MRAGDWWEDDGTWVRRAQVCRDGAISGCLTSPLCHLCPLSMPTLRGAIQEVAFCVCFCFRKVTVLISCTTKQGWACNDLQIANRVYCGIMLCATKCIYFCSMLLSGVRP